MIPSTQRRIIAAELLIHAHNVILGDIKLRGTAKMPTTISENIAAAIDELDRAKFELAFRHLCTAIEQSAKKHFKKSKISNAEYKNFLQNYYWVIELIAFPGLDLENSRFGNYSIKSDRKTIKEPSIADIIYHIIRCGLVHDDGIPDTIKFAEARCMRLDKDFLQLPAILIWGLIALVIFTECNRDQVIAKNYWIGIAGNRLCINDFFGQEAVLKAIYDKNIPISDDDRNEPLKVAILISEGHSVPITVTLA